MRPYDADPLFWQRFLCTAGFYHGALDGRFGPKSLQAARAFETLTGEIAREEGRFEPRSELQIGTLLPAAQRLARRLLAALQADPGEAGTVYHVLSGTRTYAEQNALYGRGRNGQPGPIVTRARGGYSRHNFGLAWDLGVFQDGRYLGDSELYNHAGQLGERLGLEWGGRWKQFPDPPHFQMGNTPSLSTLRERFERGIALV